MLAGGTALAALVWALLWLGLRRRADPQPRERLWIGWLGLAMPTVVLVALLAYALVLGERQLPLPGGASVSVDARAERYRWVFRHADGRTTVGVLHIPVARPVHVSITATDVIHSFWVPRLGGKMDAIPGQTNVLRIVADRPGRYWGICAEYCGSGHRNHGFSVIAHDAAEWRRLTGAGR